MSHDELPVYEVQLTEPRISSVWKCIEVWLEQNASEVLKQLPPPASAEEIRAAEVLFEVKFPADFVASYRLHNGFAAAHFGFGAASLQPLLKIVTEWTIWKQLLDAGEFECGSEPDGGVRSDWWNSGWIPITTNGCGDNECLDLNPAAGGTVGQIIEMWHDALERPRIANNFTEWLEQFASALEAGEYVYAEEYKWVVPIEDV